MLFIIEWVWVFSLGDFFFLVSEGLFIKDDISLELTNVPKN